MQGSIQDLETMTWAKNKSRTLNLLSHPGAPPQKRILNRIQVEPNQNSSSNLKPQSDHLSKDILRHFDNYTFKKIQIKNI